VQVVTDAARIFIPMEQLIDLEQERARLDKERQAVEKEIAFLEGKLSNGQFVDKAPRSVVDAERDKLGRAKEKLEKVREAVAALS